MGLHGAHQPPPPHTHTACLGSQKRRDSFLLGLVRVWHDTPILVAEGHRRVRHRLAVPSANSCTPSAALWAWLGCVGPEIVALNRTQGIGSNVVVSE